MIELIKNELLFTKHYCLRLLVSFYEFLWFFGLITFIDFSNSKYHGLEAIISQNILAGIFLLMSFINSGMVISRTLYERFSTQFAFINSTFWITFITYFNLYSLNASIIEYLIMGASFFILIISKQNEAICKRLKDHLDVRNRSRTTST